MKKIILAIVSILFTMAISTHLFAFDCESKRGHGMRNAAGHHEKEGLYALFAKLNLTKEQRNRIRELKVAHLRDTKPLRDQMFSKCGDLKLLWLQSTPDKEKILAAQKAVRGIRDQIADKATAHRLDMFTVLTPEQRDQVRAHFSGCGLDPGMGDRDMMGAGTGMMGH